jgi:hypothetical protein
MSARSDRAAADARASPAEFECRRLEDRSMPPQSTSSCLKYGRKVSPTCHARPRVFFQNTPWSHAEWLGRFSLKSRTFESLQAIHDAAADREP